ncbi:MAG TPA: glycosyltransferase family 2 protein [Candidatus Egerieousia sp.]|nr:glycosyltransferase family 2 protein [Candidatus Egerieousia sp.]HPT05857.1 glycosyltransferase family 2 protein [Candidatus Egerieousia sp.]
MKKVAIVILNWNGKSFLQKYLPSLLLSVKESKGHVVSVIVADNGSTDGSEEFVRTIGGVGYIPLGKNWGFPGGYNRAFKQIYADYYVLLNSDILTPDGWLEPLFNFMEAHKEVGVCQPKMLSLTRHLEIAEKHNSAEAKEIFEYAGAAGGFIDRWGFPFCRGRILSSLEEDNGQYNDPRKIFWASGACMMVRSTLYHRLGGLDESFFAHMEEIDFCWRAALMGSQIWAVPESYVYHLGGGTLPNNSPRKLYLNYRNNLLMLRKNLPEPRGRIRIAKKQKGFSKYYIFSPFSNRSLKLFIRKCLDGFSAVAYLAQGKFSYCGAVWKAHKDYDKMKHTLKPSPRLDGLRGPTGKSCRSIYCVNGIYPKSIIRKFFSGRKKFSDLRF